MNLKNMDPEGFLANKSVFVGNCIRRAASDARETFGVLPFKIHM
jgi:hypothetical protein